MLLLRDSQRGCLILMTAHQRPNSGQVQFLFFINRQNIHKSIPKSHSNICFISQHVNKHQTEYYITGFLQLLLKSLGLVKSLMLTKAAFI